jgi:DNA-binding NarL/FixJ family response regulator
MHTALLVDDHPLMLQGVRQTLQSIFPQITIQMASSEVAARKILASVSIDLLLTDLQLADGTGLELCRFARQQTPEPEVILLTMTCDLPTIQAAIGLGIRGYVVKTDEPEELARCLRSVFELGQSYLSASALHELTSLKQVSEYPPELQSLTKRELEIMDLILREMTSFQIAEKLHITLDTAEKHRYNLMKKLRLNSPIGLAHFAHRYGLVNK